MSISFSLPKTSCGSALRLCFIQHDKMAQLVYCIFKPSVPMYTLLSRSRQISGNYNFLSNYRFLGRAKYSARLGL